MQGTSFRLYHDAALRGARLKWILHELDAVPDLTISREDGSSMHMLESAAMVALLADAFPEKGLAPSHGRSFALTDQERLRSDISTPRALIQFYMDRLDSSLLSADERRVIKNRLDALISELQRLMRRLD